ncbi:MAG: hypothetical protein NC201_04740 [Prevotella sp.]|nr:hypothetical protein [Bacteroides sp.]MCM1366537.1 hypothetical protein [Prevotella sp.]
MKKLFMFVVLLAAVAAVYSTKSFASCDTSASICMASSSVSTIGAYMGGDDVSGAGASIMFTKFGKCELYIAGSKYVGTYKQTGATVTVSIKSKGKCTQFVFAIKRGGNYLTMSKAVTFNGKKVKLSFTTGS